MSAFLVFPKIKFSKKKIFFGNTSNVDISFRNFYDTQKQITVANLPFFSIFLFSSLYLLLKWTHLCTKEGRSQRIQTKDILHNVTYWFRIWIQRLGFKILSCIPELKKNNQLLLIYWRDDWTIYFSPDKGTFQKTVQMRLQDSGKMSAYIFSFPPECHSLKKWKCFD